MTIKPSKNPPAGLGRYPREGKLANKEDNIALRRFVRKELAQLGKLPELFGTLTQCAADDDDDEVSARFRATWSQYRPNPLAEAKRTDDIETLRKLRPDIAKYITTPKGKQGYPRNRKRPNKHIVPPGLAALARDIKAILRNHFTPTERKAWWSAEQLAIMILFGWEQGPPDWDKWIDPLTRLVEHGEEKRKRRISSSRAKQKLTG